jgi:choline dehydrogenase-like flavoprotein
MQVLDDRAAAAVRSICDVIVPGSVRIWPEVYVDALLARMPRSQRSFALSAVEALAGPASQGPGALAEHQFSPEFGLLRSLACEAFYSDFVAPGAAGPGAWSEIGFAPPLAARLRKDWSYLTGEGSGHRGPGDSRGALNAEGGHDVRTSGHYEIVIVGSGAGGGVIAGELASAGRRVLLIEAGPYKTAADYMRWEARATHELWWPVAFAEPTVPARGDDPPNLPRPGPPVAMFRGRCVGGTTAINTKVALRPHEHDFAKWHEAAGLLNQNGEPFSEPDLLPYLERVEKRLGVRERHDWGTCVHTVLPGFAAVGARVEAVRSYTDHNCMRCGSCLQGCPTNAGKNTLNSYLQPALVDGSLELRADCQVRRVLIADDGAGPEAVGVVYLGPDGDLHAVEADVVVVAAGALGTPGLLIRSGLADLPGGDLVGANLGFHPARLVAGLFDGIQDAHMVYPISAHCMQFADDADGGFIVEASTIQDPIGFATGLCDEHDVPLWGERLTEAVRCYRYFSCLLTLVNDENTGRAFVGEDGDDRYSVNFNEREQARIDASLAFARRVLEAAGARQVYQTQVLSTHVQGSCRMGSDPARSVVNSRGECHAVRRLFVGDGSAVPRTLSVNPSLTIMALATRLADYLASGDHGYFRHDYGRGHDDQHGIRTISPTSTTGQDANLASQAVTGPE